MQVEVGVSMRIDLGDEPVGQPLARGAVGLAGNMRFRFLPSSGIT
jgi:hypothetical protein